MVRVASSAGSCRRCTWRDWHGWSYCPLGLWKEENCRLQEMHQVIEICNRKVPDFSSRIDSQGWSACQAWSGWTPQPDPVGVVHGEAALSQRQKLTLCRIFSTHLFMFAPRRNTAGRRVTQPFGKKCTANISVTTTNIFGNRYSNFFCNYW